MVISLILLKIDTSTIIQIQKEQNYSTKQPRKNNLQIHFKKSYAKERLKYFDVSTIFINNITKWLFLILQKLLNYPLEEKFVILGNVDCGYNHQELINELEKKN